MTAASYLEARAAGFVEELCIALAHRWEPERLFMILTAYFDESGTHGGSPMTIMAGIVGTANQWRRFEAQYDSIRRRFGFKTFHTKRFKAKSGDFAGWPNEKCLALINEIGPLTATALMHGIVVAFSNEEYELAYKADIPPKMRIDTPYGLAFRTCLRNLVIEVIDRLQSHKKFPETKLNVVLEAGHKNAGDALRIYNEEAAEYKSLGLNLLNGLTFADKEAVPLAVADFLAHTTFARGDKALTEPISSREWTGRPVKEKTGLTHIRFEENGLAKTRQDLIDKWNAKRASSRSSGGSRP